MTFSRIFIILFIINFALAAPVIVRGVYEVHVDEVDVAEHGTATSQKRWDSGPRHDWLSAPTALQLPDLNDSGLHRPRSSTRWDNAPSSSALSTGLHPRSKDDSSSSGSPVHSTTPWVPDQSVTSSPDYSVRPTDSSMPSSSSTGPHQPTSGHPLSSSEPPRPTEPDTKDFPSQLLANPLRDPPSPAPPPYHWSPPRTLLTDPPPPFYWSPPSVSSSPESGDSPIDHSPVPSPYHWSPPSTLLTESPPPLYWSPPSASSSPEPVDSPPIDHSPVPPPYHWPPPSTLLTDPPPSLYWSPPSASSSPEPVDSSPTDHSPVPPPNPEPSLANPVESGSKSETEDFLDKLIKGKIKRHISRPGVVDSV